MKKRGIRNRKKICLWQAFTVAELLIAVLVIGIIAVLIIPDIISNYQEKAWAAGKDKFVKSMADVTNVMNVNNKMTGYASTEEFVPVFAKYIKASKTCESYDLTSCFSSSVDLDNDGGSTMGLRLNDGQTMLVSYNPRCADLTYAPGDITTGISICLNIMYDVNGDKGPNTLNKDIYMLEAGDMTAYLAKTGNGSKTGLPDTIPADYDPCDSDPCYSTDCEGYTEDNGCCSSDCCTCGGNGEDLPCCTGTTSCAASCTCTGCETGYTCNEETGECVPNCSSYCCTCAASAGGCCDGVEDCSASCSCTGCEDGYTCNSSTGECVSTCSDGSEPLYTLSDGTKFCKILGDSEYTCLTYNQCTAQKSELGLSYCGSAGDCYAGAAKACGGKSNLPTKAQLQLLANELYGTEINLKRISSGKDYQSGVTMDKDLASPFVKTNWNNISCRYCFSIWAQQEYNASRAYDWNYNSSVDTSWYTATRTSDTRFRATCMLAVCVE